MPTINPGMSISERPVVFQATRHGPVCEVVGDRTFADHVSLSSSPPLKLSAAHLLPTVFATVALLAPSPAAAAVSDADVVRALNAAQAHGIEFHKARSFHIPILTGRFDKIDAAQAAEEIRNGNGSQLSVKLPSTDEEPLRTPSNAIELDVLTSNGDVRALANPPLASLLQDIETDGYTLRAGADPGACTVAAYGTYNRLTHGWAADVDASAWVWRGEVPILPLSSDSGARAADVRDEIRRSRDALSALQKNAQAGDDEAAKDLAILGAPAGNASFAARADVLAKLQHVTRSCAATRIDYNLIVRSLREGEKVEDVAAFFVGLRTANPITEESNIQGAFNYIRSHTWNDPVRAESFQRIYGATDDINATVQAMEVLQKPLGTESYADRESFLLADAQAGEQIVGPKFRGMQAVEDYQYVASQMRPGETFGQVASDYLDVMRGVGRGCDYPISEVRRSFQFLRDQLARNPARAQDFRAVVRHVGTVEESLRTLEFIDQPSSTVSRDVRRDVLVSLLEATHEFLLPPLRFDEAKRRYLDIEKDLQTGEDFRALASLYASLMKVDRGMGPYNVALAFDYARKDLMGDPDAVARFVQVAREGRSVRDAVKVYPVLRQPFSAESEADRVTEYLRLVKLGFSQPIDIYGSVCAHLLSGETLHDGVDQFVAVSKAIKFDNDQFDNQFDTPLTREWALTDVVQAYIDSKNRFAKDPGQMKTMMRLLAKLESYASAVEALDALDAQVAGESLDAREQVLDQLVSQETRLGHAAAEGGRDYGTVARGVVKGETLTEGAARFVALLSAAHGKDAPRDARENFDWIADNFKHGSFGQKTAEEVTAILVESLLLNGNVTMARNRALSGDKKTGTVEKQDDCVIIGGIRVPVQHG